MRKFVFIGVALAAAMGTALLISNWMEAQKRPVIVKERIVARPAAAAPRVLVAESDLPAGTLLREEHLTWQPWPKAGLVDVYIIKRKGVEHGLIGAVVRQGIAKGEPITPRRVVRQGARGFLAAILTPGMRAVSVPINAASGVAGLVFPGDRVDVILTHAIGRDGGQSNKRRRASETVLRNVRLLAVDQRTNDQINQPAVAKTATLEVSPKQAEALTMLTDLGRLSLSLVSLASGDQPVDDSELIALTTRGSFTLDNEVSALLKPPPAIKKKARKKVRVMRGSKVEALTFEPSGEVKASPEGAPDDAPPSAPGDSEPDLAMASQY